MLLLKPNKSSKMDFKILIIFFKENYKNNFNVIVLRTVCYRFSIMLQFFYENFKSDYDDKTKKNYIF